MVRARRKASASGMFQNNPGIVTVTARARRFTLSLGTIEIRRPRVRNLEERFESKSVAVV